MVGNNQSPPGDAQPGQKPDRSNCPSDETLKALAHGKHVEDEALEAHLATCVYCRKELIDHKAQRELGRFFNKTTWLPDFGCRPHDFPHHIPLLQRRSAMNITRSRSGTEVVR
jgi:hypothetical protein